MKTLLILALVGFGLRNHFSKNYELTGQPSQDNYTIGIADKCFGGSATAFPAFKVSAQKGLF
jgi:hypothetical protein